MNLRVLWQFLHPFLCSYYFPLNLELFYGEHMNKNDYTCGKSGFRSQLWSYLEILMQIHVYTYTCVFSLQVALTLPVNKQPWFPSANNLLNLHIIFFPGSGIVLIKMLVTTYDLILCKRRFLRLLTRSVIKSACFRCCFIHWCLEAGSGPV